jgi:hypothetical protein
MKTKLLPAACLILTFTSLSLLLPACGALRTEFGLSPHVSTPSVSVPVVDGVSNNVPTVFVSSTPPITAQLNEVAPIVSAVVPSPWGTLISGLMNLLAAGAAAFATFHARKATNSALAAAAVSVSKTSL